jgi:diaminohydroxyphosphoribosylaminopyrimidine deaminase/5-amino-6-(5-phosphoribosylamino)uracil reductase
MKTHAEETWMLEALRLARLGEGLTRPNPPVGAVVVRARGIIGAGYHHRAGQPHAEILALKTAGAKARGADLYVTLEPCSTWGRTPPCVEAIVESGIRRVFVAIKDPNPRHAGRGLRQLRARGLEVYLGLGRNEAQRLIAPFEKWIQTGRPYLTLKLACTLDGCIADRTGAARWISSPVSRRWVHALRRRVDGVMIGAGTLLQDDPCLLPRPARGRHPYRIILAGRRKLPRTLQVFSDAERERTLVCRVGGASKRQGLNFTDLKSVMCYLGQAGLLHVLCEGGGHLAAALLEENLVDELSLILAPRVLADPRAIRAFAGRGWRLPQAPGFEITKIKQEGQDVRIMARRRF